MSRRAVGLCLAGATLILYGTIGVVLSDPPSQTMASQVYEYPGQQGYGAEPATAPAMPDEPQARADAWNYQRPCDQPETREQADLCQQWRMAKASEDLVGWSSWQFWVTAGEIGLLVLAVTFTGWAAYGAGEAATETRRAADAAIEANKTSRDLSVRQLRAYVNIDQTTISDFTPDKMPVVTVVIKNAGQTPATHLRVLSNVTLDRPAAALRARFDIQTEEQSIAAIRGGGGIVTVDIRPDVTMDQPTIDAVMKGRSICVTKCYIAYRDIFNRQRRTTAKLVLDIESLRDGKGYFRPYYRGNRST